MIDIHAHILPMLDDGAESVEDAVIMAELAAENGVSTIVATPHSSPYESAKVTDCEYVYETLKMLQSRIDSADIPVKLLPGMEVFASDDIVDRLRRKSLLTINDSRYVLVEFGFREQPYMIDTFIGRLVSASYIPIIAHPERYPFVQENPDISYDWIYGGCLLQANKGSFFGRFGRRAYETAMTLMRHNVINAVASDAHGPFMRTTSLSEIHELISDMFSLEYADILLEKNPQRIVSDKEPLVFEPIPFG